MLFVTEKTEPVQEQFLMQLPEDEITFFRAVTCKVVFLTFLPSAIEIILKKGHGTL